MKIKLMKLRAGLLAIADMLQVIKSIRSRNFGFGKKMLCLFTFRIYFTACFIH
jgi:hypothetical protein